MWTNVRNCFFIIAAVFLLGSCGNDPGTQVRLSSEERRLVDTMFLEQVKIAAPILDSICDSRFEREVRAAVDSIVKVRKAEEKMLRERMLKKNEQ